MNEYLKLHEADCRNCYKCIRHCEVKAISFNSNRAKIVHDECVLCGQCFIVCPQNAKVIRDDLPVVKEMISGDAPVYASIAPSFAANYPGVSADALRAALIKLGFADAGETAVGATIVKNYYDEMLDTEAQPILISSCCHTVNMLIRRYYPAALPYLAKIQSPMQAHCALLKRENPGAKTVFIGPCISKKEEGDRYPGIVDCVLTFAELSKWLAEEGITLDAGSAESPGGKARLFPIVGGIIRSMRADNKNYRYLVVDGIDQCIAALKDISKGGTDRCFIEMSACKGSCVGGPGMDHVNTTPVKSYIAVDKIAGSDDFLVDMPEAGLLEKDIFAKSINASKPGSKALEEALRKMGKDKPSDELNCGSCGYETCREKAAAIISGKADLSMCLPYLMEKAQSFSDTIINNTPDGVIVLNEAMEIQQINSAACSILNVRNQDDVLGMNVVCVLDPSLFAEVIASRHNVYERKICLAEYTRHVVMTVIYDKSYNIVICVMRDVTETEEEREYKKDRDRKTVEITDKVIEKQMRTVQEIASLLGETTAETKIALTKLKETLHNE
ncbi:MAG: PAS domain-containing protein [Defluviitaleaceae bacterium]|nr:PAS domain-containing protein [Defluviitaleaceae bacterium]